MSTDLQIFLTTLRSQGAVGFQELKRQFELLGIDITDPQIASTLTDDQIIISYQNYCALSSSKYQRVTLREALQKIGNYRESPAIASYLSTEPYFDVNDAYEELGIDPKVDDDVVITAYQLKMEDNYSSTQPGRALITIATTRKSMTLINFIESSLPEFSDDQITLEQAYQMFESHWTIQEVEVD
ncbi:unnamed protein product [Ambrosiozyma monospora]|uniref:Unnamed protein product n=1 Tax=Ambrosiozyma monospora TaxID=43982 RepID=A0ACB5UB58_AMBMO|nr:unnamed protein product [Ambrosiozyma monospora]